MLKEEIVDKIIKYFKLTDFEAEELYDDIFASIIQGVTEDNIADITNLGEFIVKYSNGKNISSEYTQSYKKTVEFLPVSILEEAINEISFENFGTVESEEVLNQKPVETKEDSENAYIENEEIKEIHDSVSQTSVEDKLNVEDEMNKKREEILHKITTPKEDYKPIVNVPEAKVENTSEESVEELTQKSFSDYFKEINDEQKVTQENATKTTIIPKSESVIPPAAVELHKEITEDNGKNKAYQSGVSTSRITNGNGRGDDYEKRAGDNSYYIWYKDSEPNIADTQTMSYEYELLYQATKEAEYKSKLKIYVTTFILFFSIVLLLLIFSPVFYKVFFTPNGTDNMDQFQEESGSINEETSSENRASLNILKDEGQINNITTENNVTPPTTNGEQSRNQQPQQQVQPEQTKQEPPKQEEQTVQQLRNQTQTQQQRQTEQQAPATQPNNNTNLEGLVKNGLGWLDEKNKVVYIHLENGKYTIQESAWDSEAKASKRISTLESLIPGLKGSVVRVDLGPKGIWYRVRLGEFSTIEEARARAMELRKKG